MNNPKSPPNLIAETLNALQERNYSRGTIKSFRWAYSALQRFCVEYAFEHYDEKIGERFIDACKTKQPPLSAKTIQNINRYIAELNASSNGLDWKPTRKPTVEYASSCFDKIVAEYAAYLAKTGIRKKYLRSQVHNVARFLKQADDYKVRDLCNLSAKCIYYAVKTNQSTSG